MGLRPGYQQFTVRIPDAMAEWLKERAKEARRSRAAEVEVILEPHFQAERNGRKKR